MKKIIKPFKNFFRNIGKIFDKILIVPITKLVLRITNRFGKGGKKLENWLSKPNTLLFISLALAILIFAVIDQKMINFSENSAEVLKSQKVTAIYNEEAYIIEGLPETVDITLIGSKTDLYIAKQAPKNDVTVDLTGLKPGTHDVNIKYNNTQTNIDYQVNPSVATVIIYPKLSESKTLTYDIMNGEKLDKKLAIERVNIESDEVIVKGAEYQLEKVASVKALIDIDNLVSQQVGLNKIKDVPLVAYDKKGEKINVEIVPSTIDAQLVIESPSKELPIKVVTTGELALGKAISEIRKSDANVTVYGPQSILENLTYIPVTIDVSDLKTDKEYKLDLTKPVGIKSMSINAVTIGLVLGTSTNKDVKDIKVNYINLADGYSVQAMSSDSASVTVNVKGVDSVLKNITSTNNDIKAYVDLSGLKEGTHEVEVKVEGGDERVEYISKTKKITIRIKKQ